MLSAQCPAVRTCLSVTRAPPQRYKGEALLVILRLPNLPARVRYKLLLKPNLAIQGNFEGFVSIPPMILSIMPSLKPESFMEYRIKW